MIAGGNQASGPKAGSFSDGAMRLHYVWDAWNRLVEVWEDDGDGTLETTGTPPDDTQLASYSYDGLKRRIRKVDKTGESDVTYDYYYNGDWQVLEVRKDSDTDAYKQYVWCRRYIDAPIVRFRDGNTDGDLDDGEDDTLYYLNDANRNVTALIEADGDVVERYLYDPYGRVTVLDADFSADADNASDYGNEILYCGYRYDPETGLYHVRHRHYQIALGRWVSRDSQGYIYGGDLYGYAHSSPVSATDILGLAAASSTGLGTGDPVALCLRRGGTWSHGRCIIQPTTRPRPPEEYQPDLRVPLPPGDPIIFELNTETVFGSKTPCGFFMLSALQNLEVALTWRDLEKPGLLKACAVFKRSDDEIRKLIQDIADRIIAASKENTRIPLDCKAGYKCCYKAVFDGAYPVTVELKAIQIRSFILRKPICELSGSVRGTATVQGEVGQCVKE